MSTFLKSKVVSVVLISFLFFNFSAFADIDRSIETSQVETYDSYFVDVSVISMEFMEELFLELANNKTIPFRFPDDGCYARAHKMALLLDQKGITTVKSFIFGDLRVETPNHPYGYVEWWYHVVPSLKVKGRAGLMVFDPSIFDESKSLQDWVAIQTSHNSGVYDKQFETVRFIYGPDDVNSNKRLIDYLSNDILDMERTMELYLQIQDARDKGLE